MSEENLLFSSQDADTLDSTVLFPVFTAAERTVAGKGQANPTGLILSACMMLRHLGLDHYANRLSTATYNVLAEGYLSQIDSGLIIAKLSHEISMGLHRLASLPERF